MKTISERDEAFFDQLILTLTESFHTMENGFVRVNDTSAATYIVDRAEAIMDARNSALATTREENGN